jgi:hypothetical protein
MNLIRLLISIKVVNEKKQGLKTLTSKSYTFLKHLSFRCPPSPALSTTISVRAKRASVASRFSSPASHYPEISPQGTSNQFFGQLSVSNRTATACLNHKSPKEY